MTRDWDARTYDRVADPMTRWGGVVLDRLPLDGAERVLDAGCGTGRVTESLLERLPAGHVVALDGSAAMIDGARERLARFGDRVSYLVADLGRPIPLTEPVDAVLSTATFHWVPDHDALFANLSASAVVDSSSVQLYVPVGRLAEALPLMADVSQRPTFPKQALESLRQQRLVDRKSTRLNSSH